MKCELTINLFILFSYCLKTDRYCVRPPKLSIMCIKSTNSLTANEYGRLIESLYPQMLFDILVHQMKIH